MVEWVALRLVLPMLAIAIVLIAIRALRGPTLADRVVALDVLTTIAMSIACAWAIGTGRTAFLDAGLVVGLIAFLATVAFARYLEGQGGS
jgi:multicomponent Na+:H+ antiporter subunit F